MARHHARPDTGVTESDGANPLGPRSAVPWARTRGPVAEGDVLAAAVVLTGTAPEPAPPTVVRAADGTVTVHWPDGDEDTVPFG